MYYDKPAKCLNFVKLVKNEDLVVGGPGDD